MNERIRGELEAIGATDILFTDRQRLVVDFHTAMPGDQPIRSGMEVSDGGGVWKATIRFGVLDDAVFVTHPTNDPDQMARLRQAVRTSSFPTGAFVLANYGDDHRQPRPHVHIGWAPSVADRELETVADGDGSFEPDVFGVIGYIGQVQRSLRREYRGEWADE